MSSHLDFCNNSMEPKYFDFHSIDQSGKCIHMEKN